MQPVNIVAAVSNQHEKEYFSHKNEGNNADEFKKMLAEQQKKIVNKEEHHEGPEEDNEYKDQEHTKMEKMNYYNRNAIETSFYMEVATHEFKC